MTKAEFQLIASHKPLYDLLGVDPPIAIQAKLTEELFELRTELLIAVRRVDLLKDLIALKEQQVEQY